MIARRTTTYLACTGTPPSAPRRTEVREIYSRLLDQLLEQGRFALHQMQSEQARESNEGRALLEAGFLRINERNEVELTPLALRAGEERILAELFRPRGDALAGRHDLTRPGVGPEPGDDVLPREPGAPLEHLDLTETLRESFRRGLPLQLHESDLRVRPGPTAGRCACVLLIDVSGSMARHGKFTAARRAALALQGLIRSRFPGDVLLTAGFASRAEPLSGLSILEAMPRSVGLFDAHEGTLRLPHDASDVPEHFTNVQAGLRLARRLLRQQPHAAKQVLLITDGEPTAHVEGNELVLAYPPTADTFRHTLAEASRCAAERISLGVFGLISEFSPPGLESFVQRLAETGRGRALCCSPRRLAMGLVDRFLQTRFAIRE